MKAYCLILIAVCCLAADALRASEEYKIQPVAQRPPDDLAADIAERLLPKVFKVATDKQTLCEIWLRRSIPLRADAVPSESVLYSFESGQLIGIIRFPHKTTDFRDHEIAAGVYTLRYGLQPVDG